jgi:hypothetical protein
MDTAAAVLAERLGLTDDELLRVLDADPLSVVAGDLGHRHEVPILLALTEELDAGLLRRWLRATGPGGRPLDLLLARDFGAFEDAVTAFRERGLVIRGGGRRPGEPPRA